MRGLVQAVRRRMKESRKELRSSISSPALFVNKDATDLIVSGETRKGVFLEDKKPIIRKRPNDFCFPMHKTHDTPLADETLDDDSTKEDVDIGDAKSYSAPSLEILPNLKEVGPSERSELFIKKLQMCSIVYDLNNIDEFYNEKELKRVTLCELTEYIGCGRMLLTEKIIGAAIEMVSVNVFRTLPPQNGSNSVGINGEMIEQDEDEPILEIGWPHLHVVYEFFLRFVVCPDLDIKITKKFIDHSMILQLLHLFRSGDPRERDYLKTILHRLYGKLMSLRAFIRKSIQHMFYEFLYEKETCNGISELLEILGSIINGFALPLKDEHRNFLITTLLPLHKSQHFCLYSQYLIYCMSQFVIKDSRLATPIISGVLKYWPLSNTAKEIIFLAEIEEILETTQPSDFQTIMEPLLKKICACMGSPHFQVAERALFLWHNDYVVQLINANRAALYPIILKSTNNGKQHWNSTVSGLTLNVSKLLIQMDPELYDQCAKLCSANEESERRRNEEREEKWKKIQESIKKS